MATTNLEQAMQPGMIGLGRSGASTAAEEGLLHCGLSDAGHFVKMVHNGIEYSVLAAYAEGAR